MVDAIPSVDPAPWPRGMSDDLRNVDVAIVGGGIVGCAVALAARRSGLTVAIFERGRICGEASSVAAGLICGQYDADHDTPLLRLRLAGRDVFPEFAQLLESLGGAPVGYLKGPTMGIAWTDEQRKRLLTRVATQQEAELDVEFLEPEEARRREPLLAPGVAGAALYPDGQVDTHRWAPIVHRAVLAAGVDVHQGAEVVELSGGAHAAVRTVRGTVSADHVVLATGAWARELLPWVPVAPSKGHIITFEAPNLRTRHIINMPSGTLSQRSDGRLIFGATKERVGFDRRLQAGAVASLLSAATAAIPGLATASLSGMLTGFRPEPEDGLPLIGLDPRSGVMLATGHHTHGVTMSWLTGQIVARLLTGRDPGYPIEPFSPDRFATA